MILIPSVKRNVVLNAMRTLLSVLFPLITFPYASRVLQPEGIGRVQFTSGIISYFVMLAGLGIGTYGIRETAKKRDNVEELSKVTKELFLLNLIPTAVSYVLFGIVLFALPKLTAYRNLLIVYSATILFTTLGVEWLYSGLEQYAYITVRQLVFQLISLVALFIFVRTKEDTLKYAAISVCANVGANICNFIHLRRYVRWRTSVQLEIFKHLKPVFVLFGMRIAVSVYTVLDTTMLGFVSGDQQVGYYESANKMVRIMVMLIASVTAVLLPRLSYCVEQQNDKEFHALLSKSFDVMLMVAFPFAVGFCILSDNIILLISGAAFIPSASAMRFLAVLVVVIPFGSFMTSQICIPLGKEKKSLFATIIAAVINFCLNLVFIPYFGAVGAAVASLIAESSIAIFYITVLKKVFSVFRKSVAVYFFVSVCMGCMIFFLNKLALSLILKTMVCILAGGAFYTGTLLFLKDKLLWEIILHVKNKMTKTKRANG